MNNSDDIFPSWGDLDDGKPSVWAADWIIDEGQTVEDIFVTIAYDYKEEFILRYNQVKEAYDNDKVKELLTNYISEEISEENIKELKDFFFHWLIVVDQGGKLDLSYDDFVTEQDDDFTEVAPPTLH